MGDIADMMLEGDLCEACGSAIDFEGGSGIPRYCSPQCAADRGMPPPRPTKLKRQPPTAPGSDKTACPTCGKKVKRHGLPDHLRDAHDQEVL